MPWGRARPERQRLTADFGLPYFRCLLQRLEVLVIKAEAALAGPADPSAPAAPLVTWARARYDALADAPAPTWEDLFSAEVVILQLEPPPTIAADMKRLANDYRAFGGQGPLCSFFDDWTKSDQDLRNRATLLQCEVQRLRLGHIAFEIIRSRLKFHVLVILSLLIALLVAFVLGRRYAPADARPSLLILAMIVGGFGACTNVLRRTSAVDLVDDQQSGKITGIRMRMAWVPWLSVVAGTLFAGVLYCLFAAGLVQGGLFPEVNKEAAFLVAFTTTPPPDVLAKLIAWSFIAGFAEQFAPDILDKLSQSGTSNASHNAGGAGGIGGGGGGAPGTMGILFPPPSGSASAATVPGGGAAVRFGAAHHRGTAAAGHGAPAGTAGADTTAAAHKPDGGSGDAGGHGGGSGSGPGPSGS